MLIYLRKGIAILLAAVILTAGLWAIPSFAAYAAPDNGGRVPYEFAFESLLGGARHDSRIWVIRDQQLDLGQPLEAAGWVATDEGVSGYQFLWLPAGGGTGEWQDVTSLQTIPRLDLAAAGVPYASGHGSAGFALTIEPPEGIPEGVYDVYIRALDGMGTPCDLAALLNLRYGQPDLIFDGGRVISLPRIAREGETALFGGASLENEALLLPPDGGVRLGTLNLAGYESVRITYEVTDPEAAGKTPILGLKSAGVYSYGKGEEGYNVTHSLAYARLYPEGGEITMDLKGCDEICEVWLTGHLNSTVRITEISFTANGYSTSRVAARIHFSSALDAYFSGFNRTELKPVSDPVLGDVLRMEVSEETNDPYVFFKAGALLRDHEILLDAGEYKYMVFLYRANPANNRGRMNLYLCAGPITSATEECNQGVDLKTDGLWHYLLVDLTQRANWEGVINGWRFDYISGDSDPGDCVDFAWMQFFRTYEAALAASKQDPAKSQPFTNGDPPLVKDLSEERGQEDSDVRWTLDPADTFTVTEPETDPPAEPPTEPPAEPATDPATESPSSTPSTPEEPTDAPHESTPNGKGCRSTLSIFSVLPALLLPAPLAYRRKKSIR